MDVKLDPNINIKADVNIDLNITSNFIIKNEDKYNTKEIILTKKLNNKKQKTLF